MQGGATRAEKWDRERCNLRVVFFVPGVFTTDTVGLADAVYDISVQRPANSATKVTYVCSFFGRVHVRCCCA